MGRGAATTGTAVALRGHAGELPVPVRVSDADLIREGHMLASWTKARWRGEDPELPPVLQRAVDLYRRGYEPADVALLMDRTEKTVRRWLKLAGELDGRGRPAGDRQRLSAAERALMDRLAREPRPQRPMAAKGRATQRAREAAGLPPLYHGMLSEEELADYRRRAEAAGITVPDNIRPRREPDPDMIAWLGSIEDDPLFGDLSHVMTA